MIVLGIDPGTAALGYGIVERTRGRVREVDHGCLETSPDTRLPERLLAIHALVDELHRLHQPAVVAVERLFFSKNVQTAIGVGQARGVVLLAAAQHGVPVREATPNEVKSAIAGYGAADKEQVQRMVQLVLGMAELPRPDDAADALAIAVWVANTSGSVGSATAAVLDRAAKAPDRPWRSGYERAVREAIVREKAAERERAAASATPPGARRDGETLVIASVEGARRRRRRSTRSSSRSAVIGYRVFASPAIIATAAPRASSSSTPTTWSARTSRPSTASARRRSSGSSTCC